MTKVEEEGIVETNADVKMTKDGVERNVTIDEVQKLDAEKNLWFAVNVGVYDGTAFVEGHRGGATSIIGTAGHDATDEFMAIHMFLPRTQFSVLFRTNRHSRLRNSQSHNDDVLYRLPRRSLLRHPPRRHRNSH
jgi:hypothetical protein